MNRRSFLGAGVGAVAAGPSTAKEVVDRAAQTTVGSGKVGDSFLSAAVDVASDGPTPHAPINKHTIHHIRNALGIKNKFFEVCEKYKDLPNYTPTLNANALKSVSEVARERIRMRELHERHEFNNRQEAIRHCLNSLGLKDFAAIQAAYDQYKHLLDIADPYDDW